MRKTEELKEIWKDIKGFEGLYKVSSLGNVMSLPREGSGGRKYSKILSGGICSGYLNLTLCNKGKQKRVQIHRLVAEAFIPNTENKLQVNHKNAIKTDNRLINLEWVTPSENIIHGLRNDIMNTAKGSQKPNSILNENDVVDIKNRLIKGEIGSEIAKSYNVHKGLIYGIKNGRTWKHVSV